GIRDRTVTGVQTCALPIFDVTDSAAVRAAFSGLSRLDILVNNAGVNRPQPFLEVDEATLDRLIALNIKAAFVVAQQAARLMADQIGRASCRERVENWDADV